MKLILSGNKANAARQNDRRRIGGSPRVLYRRPLLKSQWDWSPRRINALAKGIHARRYLEIGVFEGHTAENIQVRYRIGVDPDPKFDTQKLPKDFSFFAVTSDMYLTSLASDATFDLVFLDGLHTFEQTKADLFNALRHVPSGAVLIDDTVPSNEMAGLPDQDESVARQRASGLEHDLWMGDVWKVVVYIARYLPQLDFRTIVGSGNVQTLVWRRQPGEVITEPCGDEQVAVAGLTYREFFSNGVPVSFNPCNETEALQTCLDAISPQQRGGTR